MNPVMDIPYNDFAFLYPPRPESAVPPSLIPSYEGNGYVAQYKMNGTCTLLGVGPEGEIKALTRHNTRHKMWKPTDRAKVLLNYCPKGKWTLFLAELLNEKTPNIKDTLYIFDILVWESKQLIGTTFQERQDFLQELLVPVGVKKTRKNASVRTPWWEKSPDRSHLVVAPGIWLSKTVRSGLAETFERIRETGDRAVEGLVMKKPEGRLEMMFRTGNNQGWQVKSRVSLINSQMGW